MTMTKSPHYHPKKSNEEVRQLENARLSPKCGHFWNHLPGLKICPPCFTAWKAEQAAKRELYTNLRGFHRVLNPTISKADLKRMEREAGEKIIISFKLSGKRGKSYELHLTPNHADIGGVFVEVYEGHRIGGKRVASAIISTAEFAAVGALITNPEIIPSARKLVEGEVDLATLYGEKK